MQVTLNFAFLAPARVKEFHAPPFQGNLATITFQRAVGGAESYIAILYLRDTLTEVMRNKIPSTDLEVYEAFSLVEPEK